ncbi:MAG: TIGR00282 family metallophosphoesterase [Spirochaetales bacterium]|nr:TIGR00282 family metallophosphoesterase [Spirochaetales bacterium]MBQ3831153.1 TIGR00282 family metallophosphoesterase [Spirochaetales bacterium]MBQ4281879.1 TIGR00282 family metallophosphoesterase [Spirochaetales bacterium]MBQ4500957.1 TIGR00282 family metallophosphoesterase [Spirochaetales bacterium]MBQ5391597.1 TIGR00282 family metallophosphoesterase [Spirochaetales bacterium]
MSNKTFTTLLLGDIYGDPGCRVLFMKLQTLKKKYRADFVVVNGENAFKGFGIIPSQVDMLFGIGVDVITSGNHIWQQEDIYPYLDSQSSLLRPANYGNLVQGHGYVVKDNVCVINLQGRMNMPATDDPFKCAQDILKKLDSKVKTIFVDFHAESPEEKEAMGFFLDGKVTAVVGTHIHVQTMDEKILPNGTAYITDLGMCGPKGSIIGSDPELAIKRQLTQMPMKAQVLDAAAEIHGVCIRSDAETGKALSIERIAE